MPKGDGWSDSSGFAAPQFSPSAAEEIAENRSAIARENALDNLDLVIQLRVVENRKGGTTRAGFGIPRAEDDTLQPRVHDSACAHRTGFNCNIQRAAGQAVVPEPARCAPKGQDLRVRRRIFQVDRAVMGARDELTVADEHGADRDFVFR